MKNKSFYLTLAAFLVMLFAMNVLIFSFTRIKLEGSHQPLSLNDFIKQEPELQHQSFEKHRSVEEISKFQKEQVELFCTNKTVAQRRNDMLNSNIIVSTQRETAFCSVPKSGCTNLLIMFFTADGLFSNKKKYYSWTNGLINAVNRGKLGSIKNTTQRNLVLEEYFKFTMYRSPLDRFVSGYRDKVCGKDTAYFWLRDAVYKFNHGKLPSQVQVTFSDFVNYFLTSPHSGSVKGDVHFMPFQNICNPCVAKYDYYGNFDSFERDSKVLMDHMGATEDYLSPSYYNSTTAAKKENYFDQLSDAQKRGVFEYFRNELDLYYRIFPDERGIHKNMLNITDDIN